MLNLSQSLREYQTNQTEGLSTKHVTSTLRKSQGHEELSQVEGDQGDVTTKCIVLVALLEQEKDTNENGNLNIMSRLVH